MGNITHGHCINGPSKTYKAWCSMRARCLIPSATGYENYGGRGITICKRWDSFENFLEDMGEVPYGLTLERKDVNGHYCLENCKWATVTEQNSNQRIRKDNKSSRVGVSKAGKDYWRAYGSRKGVTHHLYWGKSFSEACKARELWEENRGVNHG